MSRHLITFWLAPHWTATALPVPLANPSGTGILLSVENIRLDAFDRTNLDLLGARQEAFLDACAADRIVVMSEGKNFEEAESDELFADPRNSHTKKLPAAIPQLAATA